MPTPAFLAAAKKADRQPVVLMAVESINALKAVSDTKSAWQAAKILDPQINLVSTDNSASLALPSFPASCFAEYPVNWTMYRSGYSFTPTYNCYLHTLIFNVRWDESWAPISPKFRLKIKDVNDIAIYTSGYVECPVSAQSSWLQSPIPAVGGWMTFIVPNVSVSAGTTVRCVIERESFTWYVDSSAGSSYRDGLRIYYSTGTIQTKTLDLGSTPTLPGRIGIDDTVPTGCGIIYTARGSADGVTWTSLGAVVDGQSIAAYRYYDVTATLTSNGTDTPVLKAIRIIGGDSQYDYYSTHKNIPIQGAKPYIVQGSVSSLSSKIELMAAATTGELGLKLAWTKKTGDMVSTGYLKNKATICKLGFVGLGESDFEPYFTGTWFDHADDPDRLEITVKTRNAWKQFKTKVPDENYFLDAIGTKIEGKVYALAGNIIDMIIAVVDLSGVPDRYIDRAAFAALKTASFTGTDWNVSRNLTEPVEAATLMIELAVSAGLFLPVLANGCITPVHYDTVIASTPAATLDARKYSFKPIAGGQNTLFTRQAVYYQMLAGKTGGGKGDFAKGLVKINTAAETAWNESYTKEWLDKWVLAPVAIERLIQRMDAWYANPRLTVKVDGLPPKYMGVQLGSLVAVDWLRLPAPAASWPGYSSAKNFLVMARSINPRDLTLSLDLFEVGPTTYLTGSLPAYPSWGLFPPVTGLALSEMVVQRVSGALESVLRVSFTEPSDFHYGGAEIWVRKAGGTWGMVQAITFGAPSSARVVDVPAVVSYSYDVAVCTVNTANRRQPLDQAPTASKTITGANYSQVTETVIVPGQTAPGSTVPNVTLPAPPLDGTLTVVGQLQATPTPAVLPGVALPGVFSTWLQDSNQVALDMITKKEEVKNALITLSAHTGDIVGLNATVSGMISNDWSSSTAYTINTYARYSGTVYRCILATTAGILPTNTTYWEPASSMLTLISSVQQRVDTLDGVVATKVATTTYNTKTGELVAADNAMTLRADGLDSRITSTTTDLTAATGRITVAESNITQNAGNITLAAQSITGPLAFVAGAVVQPGVQVESVADVKGLEVQISKTRINMDTANATITLQSSQIDTLTGRMTTAEVAIDGANASIKLRATKDDLSGQVSILSDQISLKLNATGTVGAGMQIAWADPSHTRSVITLLSDTFMVARPDGTGAKSVFTVGLVNGVSTVGINGNLFVDGTVTAKSIVMANIAALTGTEAIQNSLVTVDGSGLLQGIGTGAGTAVQNSLLTPSINSAATTATWTGVATKPANVAALTGTEAIQNSLVTVDGSGLLQGIGIGAGTAVQNSKITIDVSGNIQGIGSGSGSAVNNQMITINANGQLVGVGTANITVDNSKITLSSLNAMALNPGTPTTLGSNWIYTGTLTAAQVNAVAIDAGSIAAGILTGRTIQTTASTTAEQIKLDAATNRQTFRGLNRITGGSYQTLATFGSVTPSGNISSRGVVVAGDDLTGVTYLIGGPTVDTVTASDLVGIVGVSALAEGVIGSSVNSSGIYGYSYFGNGVYGYSRGKYGLVGESKGYGDLPSSSNGKGPLLLIPSNHINYETPTHAADPGTFFVTNGGKLYYRNATGWVLLAN